MVRNAGKRGKPIRGGARNFSNFDHMNRPPSDPSDESSETSEHSEEEEESEPEQSNIAAVGDPSSGPSNGRTIAEERAARRAAKKGNKVGFAPKTASGGEQSDDGDVLDDDGMGNLNRAVKKNVKISELVANDGELSRKEKEAAEKKAAQEHYWKLHQEGKTSQAKADLARLAKIRAEREAAKAVRDATQEIKAQETKKAAEEAQKKMVKK
ncbi:hypothetical protein BT69DRAFT_1354799 [Atractiella rhizophila]|nr:hypothetical protein BT69DRAFT_1354799 [Atractiella rhizophila]